MINFPFKDIERLYCIMVTTAFISEWNIDNSWDFRNSYTITLPLLATGIYNFDINWGDNTPIEHYTSHNCSHTYNSTGHYIVSITGTIVGWRGGGNSLVDIKQWGCLKLGNDGYYFQKCTNLQITATDAPDLTHTTNLEWMFDWCVNFNSPINHWDVSRVTNMRAMFQNADKFDQPLDKWDTSNVTDMSGMFCMAYSFDQPIGMWNTHNVTCMRNMFSCALCFNQPLEDWDTSNVTNMYRMFYKARQFNQSLSKWNISKVINLNQMFYGIRHYNKSA